MRRVHGHPFVPPMKIPCPEVQRRIPAERPHRRRAQFFDPAAAPYLGLSGGHAESR